MSLIIELLDTNVHARNDFFNENSAIDKFLKERANKEHKQNISDTYVLVDDSNRARIHGFFTLSLSSVILTTPPPRLSRYPQYGTVLLGRMGRDHNHSPKGFGAIIIKEAMREALKRGTFYALEVHAKDSADDKLIEYYKGFGFIQLSDDKCHLIMPREVIISVINESNQRK